MLDINSIGRKENRQRKRIFDVFFSLVCFVFYPILIFFVKRKKMFFNNIISCLTGKKTWVGYTPLTTDSQQDSLPLLRKGVLFSADALNLERYNDDIIEHVNSLYARNYKLFGDIHIILKEFRNLGR
jgi:hypothetical protein